MYAAISMVISVSVFNVDIVSKRQQYFYVCCNLNGNICICIPMQPGSETELVQMVQKAALLRKATDLRRPEEADNVMDLDDSNSPLAVLVDEVR